METSELQVYAESYFWDLNEEIVRLTITRKHAVENPGHPLVIAKFARLLADRWEEFYKQCPDAWGPYEEPTDA